MPHDVYPRNTLDFYGIQHQSFYCERRSRFPDAGLLCFRNIKPYSRLVPYSKSALGIPDNKTAVLAGYKIKNAGLVVKIT
jgi:hypothetical protein